MEWIDQLTRWYDQNARDLPWRHTRDPYKILVSEVMLQQTRVKAALGYYLRFIDACPDVYALSRLPEDELMKLWEGLGYYSRARNLKKAASAVAETWNGVFPADYQKLLSLPGVGPYTAGAVGSIAFGLKEPAVDGNVLRILSRIAGISAPVDLPATKQSAAEALALLYPAQRRGDFAQSLMELGATVCLPNGAPKCGACPAALLCFARENGAVAHFPVKSGKKPRRVENHTVLLLVCGDELALRRREGDGLLGGLWELPNAPGSLDAQHALDLAAEWGAKPLKLTRQFSRAHIFTHIRWEMTCYVMECCVRSPRFVWTDRAGLEKDYALPSAFRKLLEGLYD